ncbi:hypothetical protein [Nitrospirillum sp. BR 11828]|uniref:hypothetical protein n=1 Tax=Nitrospirillum sp. BR 11828 TaxID=3104325 RepID=UPI002ACA1239|nr:hypothetical protein [Nitrospirillum sp. BR 11828]MDZ5647165.1 hypothetical protein [Nitrospirillum sp. BR 11828]
MSREPITRLDLFIAAAYVAEMARSFGMDKKTVINRAASCGHYEPARLLPMTSSESDFLFRCC